MLVRTMNNWIRNRMEEWDGWGAGTAVFVLFVIGVGLVFRYSDGLSNREGG